MRTVPQYPWPARGASSTPALLPSAARARAPRDRSTDALGRTRNERDLP